MQGFPEHSRQFRRVVGVDQGCVVLDGNGKLDKLVLDVLRSSGRNC